MPPLAKIPHVCQNLIKASNTGTGLTLWLAMEELAHTQKHDLSLFACASEDLQVLSVNDG